MANQLTKVLVRLIFIILISNILYVSWSFTGEFDSILHPVSFFAFGGTLAFSLTICAIAWLPAAFPKSCWKAQNQGQQYTIKSQSGAIIPALMIFASSYSILTFFEPRLAPARGDLVPVACIIIGIPLLSSATYKLLRERSATSSITIDKNEFRIERGIGDVWTFPLNEITSVSSRGKSGWCPKVTVTGAGQQTRRNWFPGQRSNSAINQIVILGDLIGHTDPVDVAWNIRRKIRK